MEFSEFSSPSFEQLQLWDIGDKCGVPGITVLKVGRTIADLEGADLIDTPHIAEALQYRKREGE